MKKSFALLALVGVAGSAMAAPLNLEFDELTSYASVGAYNGFTFDSNFVAISQSDYQAGWGNSYPFPSAEIAVYNAFGNVDSTVTHAGDFDFIGGYFTSWDMGNAQFWASSPSVTVSGYDDSVLVGSVTLNLNGGGFQYLSANFSSIDTLVITNGGSVGQWYLLDSLRVDNVESVPEPASMAVLGMGAAAFIRRRRATRA